MPGSIRGLMPSAGPGAKPCARAKRCASGRTSTACATARPPIANSPRRARERFRAGPTTSRRWASITTSSSRSARQTCARASTSSRPPELTRASSLRLKEAIMKGDFSRDTFDPLKHFTRVLMQQGRVQLDADWNEQTAMLRHYIRALAGDLIGPHGGPEGLCGFRILTHDMLNTSCGHDTPETVGESVLYPLTLPGNFMIGTGRYYVGGLLCENERMALYAP